ncbi:MAG: hypothetical protein R6U37_04000 [Dehalococcoidia bacterium]
MAFLLVSLRYIICQKLRDIEIFWQKVSDMLYYMNQMELCQVYQGRICANASGVVPACHEIIFLKDASVDDLT